MSEPIAVATGDVHFTEGTLELATASVNQGLDLAADLDVPFILNGDTLDGKGAIRALCANRLIALLTRKDRRPPRIIINTGNHDKIHEKSAYHSLNFLRPYAEVIDAPTYDKTLNSWIVPYFNDRAALEAFLTSVPKGSRLLMHQGVVSAKMGHYVVDKTSLSTDVYADFRVISSHYHCRQDIKCGRPRKGAVGLYSYLGSPYSITFAEAHDGPKGINVVYDDGTIELIPTNLRKHVKLELSLAELALLEPLTPDDLLWLIVHGPFSELEKLNKRTIGMQLLGHANFKFEKIDDEAESLAENVDEVPAMDVLDRLIDLTPESVEQKVYLKSLTREILA